MSAAGSEKLAELAGRGLAVGQIASALGWTSRRVRYWLRREGIGTVDWAPKPRALAAGHEVDRTCKRHGRTTFVLEGRGYYPGARAAVATTCSLHAVERGDG